MMNQQSSSHNQSIHEYLLEKVLSTCKDEFIRDFDIRDVASLLKRAGIFKDEEIHEIVKESSPTARIEKLFFMVVYKNKNIEEFLRVIRMPYDWLANRIDMDLKMLYEIGIEQDEYYQNIRRLRKEIPRHNDYNVHRCEYLWKIKQNLETLAQHEYLVVHGSLAFGKRWIVMDACCNYSVMHRMGGKIFWVNCSNCKTPETIYQELESLAIIAMNGDVTLSNHKDINSKIISLNQELRRSFKKSYMQNCLIVLINVHTYEALKAFDLNCKVMVTTGNKWILDKLSNSTIKVEIASGFTRDETLELFSKVLDLNVSDLPREANDLWRHSKRNIFLISLIANNLKEYTTNQIIRWQYWVEAMTKHELTNNSEVQGLIKESLKQLSSEYLLLFRSLVIFPDNVSIPVKVMQLYWNKNQRDVEEIIRKFDKLYLLEIKYAKDGEQFCSLHYFYYSYLTNSIDNTDKCRMHKTLVNNYRITEALATRVEPDIELLPDDRYFHFFIGHHLKEANMCELFPKLYLDFGFLEQKLRSTGLPNLLGDLSTYKKEITGGDRARLDHLQDLQNFLPTIEEAIVKSMDTCLLQYAITTDNGIRQEAIKQAKMFPNRVWFNGIDHSYKHRQIVLLPQKPSLIRFVDPDYSLIAFKDHSILLTDMSTQYTAEPTVYSGHEDEIVCTEVFLGDYFGSLDRAGTIKIWSLKETAIERRRRSRTDREDQRLAARQHINPECFGAQNATQGLSIQTIDNQSNANRNTCFLINQGETDAETRMFVATKNGRILTYQWNSHSSMFEYCYMESFDTKIANIRQLFFIPNVYLLVLNEFGVNAFFNLRDQSQVPRMRKMDLACEAPIGVHQLKSKKLSVTMTSPKQVAIVYCNRIYYISVSLIANIMSPEMRILSLSDDDQNFITCSAVTEDNLYLVLGTKKGIIVYDPEQSRELLRSSVSDSITCIDVCSLDDTDYKYIIISATKKGGPAINVHGIMMENGNMQWASNKIGSPINETNLNGRESMTAWLSGGQLFDVVEDLSDGSFKLFAADAHMFLHRKESHDHFVKSYSRSMVQKITALSFGLKSGYVACDNGMVFQYDREQPFLIFDGAIEYLKYYEEIDVVIAGTKDKYQIRRGTQDYFEEPRESPTIRQSFLYENRYIILIKEDCFIDFFDIKHNKITPKVAVNARETLSGCAFFANTLFIGSSKAVIHEYHIKPKEKSRVAHINEFEMNKNADGIKSIAYTSGEKSILAVGYCRGMIEVYDCINDKVQLLQSLVSHKEAVYALRFSNWIDGQTLILASVSEELCFWNITHILNNPLGSGNLRRSQRFSRRHSKSSIASALDTAVEMTNGAAADRANNNNINGNHLTITNLTNGHAIINGNGGAIRTANDTNIISPISQLNQSFSNLQLNTPTSPLVPDIVQLSHVNPWIGKRGASNKLELLSCIKFVGNAAEKIYANQQFTKFITIDSDGEIYYLDINYGENI